MKNNRIKLILLILIPLFVFLITYYYINQEKFLYYWDLSHYWRLYQEIMFSLKTNFWDGIKRLVLSIRNEQYNYLVVAILYPWFLLFGAGRKAYIVGITTIYITGIVLSWFIALKKNSDISLVVLLSILLSPFLYFGLLRGFPDIAGIIPIGVVTFIYFKDECRVRLNRVFWYAVFLLLAVVIRRWYLYWVISFFVVNIVKEFVYWIINKKTNLLSIIIVGIIWILLLLMFTFGFVKSIIFENYFDIYSAWKVNKTVLMEFNNIFSNLGFDLIFYFIFSIFLDIKKKLYDKKIVFLFLVSCLSFIFFSRTQSFALQHLCLFIPLSIYVRYKFISYLSSKKKIYVVVYVFFLTLLFYNTFQKAPSIFSRMRFTNVYLPLNRNDISSIDTLLDDLYEIHLSGERLYTLSSGSILNGNILQNRCVDRWGFSDFCTSFLTTSDVDKRDGINKEMFNATYLILQTPVGYHLNPSDQRVVGYFYDEITKGSLKKHYKVLDNKYKLYDDSGVGIYKKINEYSNDEKNIIQEYFYKLYPDYESKFKII